MTNRSPVRAYQLTGAARWFVTLQRATTSALVAVGLLFAGALALTFVPNPRVQPTTPGQSADFMAGALGLAMLVFFPVVLVSPLAQAIQRVLVARSLVRSSEAGDHDEVPVLWQLQHVAKGSQLMPHAEGDFHWNRLLMLPATLAAGITGAMLFNGGVPGWMWVADGIVAVGYLVARLVLLLLAQMGRRAFQSLLERWPQRVVESAYHRVDARVADLSTDSRRLVKALQPGPFGWSHPVLWWPALLLLGTHIASIFGEGTYEHPYVGPTVPGRLLWLVPALAVAHLVADDRVQRRRVDTANRALEQLFASAEASPPGPTLEESD